ncbi:hypothetical protein ACIBQ1_38360 [Nonomuraea sp. NPDC050153]|uniref:DUF7736 domain-containing protein n=1 Tax=Nonomuraea sp. NPDC050153 TaxID=3364359 RepID=UPI00378D960B
MTETRDFHIGDILSGASHVLVSPTRFDGLYQILNWMTGDNLFTHQLPRAAEECTPSLLAQHPDLAEVDVPKSFEDEATYEAWMTEQVALYGEIRPVAPLEAVDHTRIDPVDEARMRRPDATIIEIEDDRG